jgi:hypothetical protein
MPSHYPRGEANYKLAALINQKLPKTELCRIKERGRSSETASPWMKRTEQYGHEKVARKTAANQPALRLKSISQLAMRTPAST